MDPWHFGTDPDPRIRSTDLRIRILPIRQWLKKKFFFLSFLLITFWSYIYISFIDKRSKRSPDAYKKMMDPDPGGLKTYGSNGTEPRPTTLTSCFVFVYFHISGGGRRDIIRLWRISDRVECSHPVAHQQSHCHLQRTFRLVHFDSFGNFLIRIAFAWASTWLLNCCTILYR